MTDEATFVRDFGGREVLFRYPIPGQLMILRRRTLRLQEQMQHAEAIEDKVKLESKLITDTLDLVESLIVAPEDAEYLEQAMLLGKVTHEQVMEVLATKREEVKKAKPVKSVTRGAKRAGSKR